MDENVIGPGLRFGHVAKDERFRTAWFEAEKRLHAAALPSSRKTSLATAIFMTSVVPSATCAMRP